MSSSVGRLTQFRRDDNNSYLDRQVMRMVGQIEMCRLDGISADVLTRSSIYVLCECWFVIIAKRLLTQINQMFAECLSVSASGQRRAQ